MFVSSPIHNPIITPRRKPENDKIYHRKHCRRCRKAPNEQRRIRQPEYLHDKLEHWKRHRKMNHCDRNRHKKYGSHLRMNRRLYHVAAQAYLRHNRKAFPVLKAFRYLLVINNQYSYHQKHTAKKQPEEQKSAVCFHINIFLFCP